MPHWKPSKTVEAKFRFQYCLHYRLFSVIALAILFYRCFILSPPWIKKKIIRGSNLHPTCMKMIKMTAMHLSINSFLLLTAYPTSFSGLIPADAGWELGAPRPSLSKNKMPSLDRTGGNPHKWCAHSFLFLVTFSRRV